MKTLLTIILFIPTGFVNAQTPVKWEYTARKISDKSYEVHIKASVQSPWHIYSQTTPDGGPLATKISFNKNPLITFQGKAKEVGKMMTKHEDVFGVDVKYFDGGVDFVQVVKMKTNAKTNVSGSVEFMVCNDEECLPPKTEKFSVVLE